MDTHFSFYFMLSERHGISTRLNRWLRCIVKAPKVVMSDQSLALVSVLTRTFIQHKISRTEFSSCLFSIVVLRNDEEFLACFIGTFCSSHFRTERKHRFKMDSNGIYLGNGLDYYSLFLLRLLFLEHVLMKLSKY